MADEYDFVVYHLAQVVNEQVNPNLKAQIHWSGTDNALTRTDNTYATSRFSASYSSAEKKTVYNKPYTLTGHQFELNLPSNAYVKEIQFIARMKVDKGVNVVRPNCRFNIYGKATTSKYDDTKVNGTGWNSGSYCIYPTADLSDKWMDLTYTMKEEDILKGGFDISAFNSTIMGIDLVFNSARNQVSKTTAWNVYCAYIELRVKYEIPKYTVKWTDLTPVENIRVNEPYQVRATFLTQSKANDGTQVIDVDIPVGFEIIDSLASRGTFNPTTREWTIDSSKNANLTLTLKPLVSGDNQIVLDNTALGTYPHPFYVNRGGDSDGAVGLDLSTSPNPHKNHRMCVFVDAVGQSESNTTATFTFTNNQTVTGGTWELETGSTGVSIASNTDNVLTLNVPQYSKYTAKLKYCYYPSVVGSNTATVNDSTIDYDVANPYVYVISSEPSENENEAYLTGQDIMIVDHRVSSDTDMYGNYLPSQVVEEDSLMTQSECSLKMYMQKDLDYIGCIPLEQTHFDPKSTFKDTLIDTHYKNKRYMGKKLATDEDITLNVRLHPKQVTTLQGLIEMDKPIPINTNHKSFEGDSLNHRGWVEVYAVNTTYTNPHWYKCDIDVKYLTHNLNTRFHIEKGVKVATYDYPSLMVESVGSGTSLDDGYFMVDTDGTFLYNDDEEAEDTVRNILSITNNQYFNIKSTDILPNQSVVSYEWLSTLMAEDKENNIHRIIRLIDNETNQTVFEYEYANIEITDDTVSASLISRRWDGVGWDTSTQNDIALWRDYSILDDDEVEDEDNEQLYGSTTLFNITNNKLNVIETGFNGRETSQSFELTGSGKYIYEIDVKNWNTDAETGAVDFYVDLTVMDTLLTSDYAEKYSKLYVSPFPVANKEIVFTRQAEEGTIYYLEDDGEEFTYLINPYYQYKNGTDLVYDGYSIFSLNYGYDVVYIQNGLVRLGFNRLNGRLYLGKYDSKSREYINLYRFHLEKYDDININSISDDKIEIQASDSVFTIYRGHPYIMINHNNEDIWFDTTIGTVWAEKVGGDYPTDLPSYWDLMNNSNLLPMSVGGKKGLSSSDVVVSEVEVSDRDTSTLDIVDIYDGTTHYSDFDDVPFEVGKDYIFTLEGEIETIGDEIPTGLGVYEGELGTYTISTDSDKTIPYGIRLYATKDIIQIGDTIQLQGTVLDYDEDGISGKSVDFIQKNKQLYTTTGETSSTLPNYWSNLSNTANTLTIDSTGILIETDASQYSSTYMQIIPYIFDYYQFVDEGFVIEYDSITIDKMSPMLAIKKTDGTYNYPNFFREGHCRLEVDKNGYKFYVDDVLDSQRSASMSIESFRWYLQASRSNGNSSFKFKDLTITGDVKVYPITDTLYTDTGSNYVTIRATTTTSGNNRTVTATGDYAHFLLGANERLYPLPIIAEFDISSRTVVGGGGTALDVYDGPNEYLIWFNRTGHYKILIDENGAKAIEGNIGVSTSGNIVSGTVRASMYLGKNTESITFNDLKIYKTVPISTTNVNGIATCNLIGDGSGEEHYIAKVQDLESNEYNLIDATYLDRATSSDKNDTMWNSTTGFTREADGTSVSITQQVYTYLTNVGSGYRVELDLTSAENYCRTNIARYQDGQTTTYHGYSFNTGGHITIDITPTQIIFKQDNTVLQTINNSTNNQFRFFFVIESGTSKSEFKFKDLRIYPL